VLRALVVVCLLASTASAESWYRGEHGTNRILHLSIAVVGGAAYTALEVPLEDNLAPTTCHWCDPTGLDTGVRDALRWSDGNASSAATASHLTVYGLAPIASVGLVALGTFDEPSWAQVIDDFTPIAEALVINAWVTRGLKLMIGRQRPYAHFAGPQSTEDNLSFPSGHTSFAFAVVTSSAMIARARGYRSEPYIWATGLTLAAAGGYFRIAADKHYVTDVLAGAAVGTAAGLTVPLLMRRNAPVVVPTRDGAAVVGSW
jgi:membrane-associated phospholipid phosphatase